MSLLYSNIYPIAMDNPSFGWIDASAGFVRVLVHGLFWNYMFNFVAREHYCFDVIVKFLWVYFLLVTKMLVC